MKLIYLICYSSLNLITLQYSCAITIALLCITLQSCNIKEIHHSLHVKKNRIAFVDSLGAKDFINPCVQSH